MSKPKPAEGTDSYEKRLSPPPRKGRWFRRSFASFFLLLAVTVIVISSLFSEWATHKLITNLVAENTNGRIELNVTKASILRGFIFDDIVLQAGPDFKHKPLFEMKRFSLLYNVFGFWVGDFGVHEVGLYEPRIYLKQQKNKWNFATLAKASEKKTEKEKPEEETSPGPQRDFIDTIFSMRLFFKFVLEDLYVSAESDDASSQPIEAELKDFTFRLHLLSKKFDQVPLGVSAIRLFETVLLQLNPGQRISLKFKTRDVETKTGFDLHWLLAYDGKKDQPEFNSQMIIGDKNIPVRYKGRHKLPLNLDINYKLDYLPETDILNLDFFRVIVLKDTWLKMQGTVKNIHKSAVDKEKPMEVDLRLDQSNISLSRLYPIYRKVTGDNSLRFGGSLSLAPMAITGTLNNLKIKGNMALRGVKVNASGIPANINRFTLAYDTALNLNKKDPLGMIRYARLKYNGSLNGARLKADILFDPAQKTDIDLAFLNLAPSPFIPRKARNSFDTSGRFDVKLKVAGEALNNLALRADLTSKGFHYFLNRGKSGVNRINLAVRGNLKGKSVNEVKKGNINLGISKGEVTIHNQAGKKAFWTNSELTIKKRGSKIDMYHKLEELAFHFQNLLPTLPDAIVEQLGFFKERLYRRVSLYGENEIKLDGRQTRIESVTRSSIFDYNVHDITLKAKAILKPKHIRIPSITLKGMKKALDLKIYGDYKQGTVEKPDYDQGGKLVKVTKMLPNIHMRFKFGKPERGQIFDQNYVRGDFSIKAHYKDTIINGNLGIKDFFFDNPKQKLKINNVNMNFPFLFNDSLRKPLNLTAGNKERIIKNYNFSKPFNFTVDSVDIEHPTRKGESLKVIYPQGEYPGIGGRIEFKDNVFEIPFFQVFTLNGLVTLQDGLFNLGTINKKYMEFIAQVQVKEVDLRLLMPKTKTEGIDDGKIGVDMFFTGRRMDKRVIDQVKGYVSVYKIGNRFGSDALDIVLPTGGITKWALNNSVILKKLDLKLNEGLVYAEAHLSKRILGRLIAAPKNDEIKQSRIPITEFFQNIEKKAQVYGADGSEDIASVPQ